MRTPSKNNPACGIGARTFDAVDLQASRRNAVNDGRSNVLQIGLDGTRFEMDPCLPSVKVGFEPLIVGASWAKNRGTWKRVVLKEFAFADGTPCEVDPPEVAFDD